MAPNLNVGDLFSVKGRVALITGGTSGIGFMIASALVSNGSKVYITALETVDFADQIAKLETLGKTSGGQAIGFIGDVSSKESIQAIADFVIAKERHLDILISNAGIRRDPPVMCDVQTASLEELQMSMWSSRHSDWEDTFRINVAAHYFLSVSLMKLLAAASNLDIGNGRKGRDEGRGVVVITSSCASMHNCTNIDLTSYATSKAAIDHLVPLLASKYAPWYIRVCAINPGFVPSRMNPVSDGDNQFGALFDKMPAKRIGRTEDIAGVILYLCSEAGAYVDGRCICVDGGRTLFANVYSLVESVPYSPTEAIFTPAAHVSRINRRGTADKGDLFYDKTTKELYEDLINNNYQGSLEDFRCSSYDVSRPLEA